MRKVLFCFMTACACILSFSCTTNEESHQDGHRIVNKLIPMDNGDSKSANNFLLYLYCGHSIKECGGKCLEINGVLTHADCIGAGAYCPLASSMQLVNAGGVLTAITTDTFGLTSLDFFAMPDRSLDYVDENNNKIYLNIPAQTVYRDSTTLQFTFTGLYFSSTPAYNND